MGRSHFSGGGGRSHISSSGGGRSHFSSRSSSYSRGPSRHSSMHHHHHSHIGGPHIHTSIHLRGPSGAIVAILIAYIIFFVAPLVISFSNVNQSLDEIRTSYYYYQTMIDQAERNSNYQMEGVVTGIYQDGKYDDAWYLKYTVYNHNRTQTYISQFTFSVYDSDDIEDIELGDTIMVAVDNPTPPIFDSIDMNYGDVELEDDPEFEKYTENKKTLTKTFTIYGIIATAIAGICLTIVIVPMIKKLKQKDNGETISSTNVQPEKPKTKYCAYCGVELENGTDKCSVCGARNNKQ